MNALVVAADKGMLPGRYDANIILTGSDHDGSRTLFDEDDAPWDAPEEVVPLDMVDSVIGPIGPQDITSMVRRTDCPVAPELLKPLPAPGTA